MKQIKNCVGCAFLEWEQSGKRFLALCCDPDKPIHGSRRALDNRADPERAAVIETPVWCRGKAKKEAATVVTTP